MNLHLAVFALVPIWAFFLLISDAGWDRIGMISLALITLAGTWLNRRDTAKVDKKVEDTKIAVDEAKVVVNTVRSEVANTKATVVETKATVDATKAEVVEVRAEGSLTHGLVNSLAKEKREQAEQIASLESEIARLTGEKTGEVLGLAAAKATAMEKADAIKEGMGMVKTQPGTQEPVHDTLKEASVHLMDDAEKKPK